MLGIKSVPIEFGIDGRRRWLYIKNSIELEIEGVKGIDSNKESCIVNPAFSAVPGSDSVVAHSSNYNYNDYGLQWNKVRINQVMKFQVGGYVCESSETALYSHLPTLFFISSVTVFR